MSATSSKSTTEAEAPFWQTVALGDMTAQQWEAVCDGCGKCCLHKLEDADDGTTHYTNVACRLLNLVTCQCKNYPDRKRYVPDCIKLTVKNIPRFAWLPSTCAYRLLAAGKPLPEWHPLISGTPQSVIDAGHSVKGRAIAEHLAGQFSQHLVDWWD